jgi:hypothetical protein
MDKVVYTERDVSGMASKRRGRTVAIAAGLGLVAVLALAGIYRTDLAVRYHVWRLERDPAWLAKIAGRPEETAARRAIREHLGMTLLFAYNLDLPDEPPLESATLDEYLTRRLAGEIRWEGQREGFLYFVLDGPEIWDSLCGRSICLKYCRTPLAEPLQP